MNVTGPYNNPLGIDETGTTLSLTGKATTGGQKTEVTEKEKASGTIGVSQTEKSEIGETSTVVAADSVAESKPPQDPDAPEIGATRNFKPKNGANPWFSSTYLSRLSENYTEIAKLGKEMHVAEGTMSVLMLLGIAQDAKTNADLIILKAQKEANMHMAMAIAAVAGLAVSVAGAGLSVAGGMKGAGAKMRANRMKADGPDAPQSAKTANAGSTPSVGPTAKAKKSPLKNDNTVDQPSGTNDPASTKIKQPEKNSSKAASKSGDDAASSSSSTSNERGDANVSGEASTSAKPDDVAAPTEVGKQQPAKQVSERDQIALDKRDAGSMSSMGHAISTAAPIVNNIMENIIQMIAKPDIAKTERDLELSRANKELKSKALDSSIQAFNGATEIIDSAVRSMDKLGDVIKANSINSRGG